MKKLGILLLSGFLLCTISGCNSKENNGNNNQNAGYNNIGESLNKKDIIGTWNYKESNHETMTITITEDKVKIDDKSYDYDVYGKWIFLHPDVEIVLYIIDNKNIIGLEGLHFTK